VVIATIHIATAIITEATLSFLGVGVPATQPLLEWWITVLDVSVQAQILNLMAETSRTASASPTSSSRTTSPWCRW
jgi:ABC-type dipeptide/oligopeptide/nickel transport system permease subunit